MPLYEYQCSQHGRFERLEGTLAPTITCCPVCGANSRRVVSLVGGIKVVEHERRMLGSKSKGRYLSSAETGGLPILIPSFGALEKEEIDYTAEVAIAQEKERVAKKRPVNEGNALKKQALSNVVNITKSAAKGKRMKQLKEVGKDGLR